MSEYENTLLARQWFEEVWNQKNEATIDRMFSMHGEAYGFPNPDSVIVGPQAFKEAHRTFCGAFPDLSVEIQDIVSEGNRVAIRWKVNMTHRGDHLGIPASGKQATLHGSSFNIVENGQLIKGWNQMDFQRLLKEISPA